MVYDLDLTIDNYIKIKVSGTGSNKKNIGRKIYPNNFESEFVLTLRFKVKSITSMYQGRIGIIGTNESPGTPPFNFGLSFSCRI